MFNQLLRNLPFNPSLITEVAFYAKRLNREAYVRKVGLVAMALTLFVQTLAFVSPPQPTLATSNNDMISGGVASSDDAAKRCYENDNGFRDAIEEFGADCDSVKNSHPVTLDSKDTTENYHTLGKLAYGKKGETPVAVKGKTLWSRDLKDLDHDGSSKHEALETKTKSGGKIYVEKKSGCVTFHGTPPLPAKKCEWNNTLLATDPKCFEPCTLAGKSDMPKTSPYCQAPCTVKDKTNLKASDPGCFEPCNVKGKEAIAKNSTQCFTPCEFNSLIASVNPSCKPCEASLNSVDTTACLVLSKTARNDTKKVDNADGTTVSGDDVIVYTMSAKNQGKSEVKSFVIQENISDVLDYARIVDLGNGADIDKNNIVSWPASAIAPGATLSRQITVKVRSPIPTTPSSTSDPNHFDLQMTNVYGNAINIKLPSGVVKSAEVLTRTTLPNTGPGTSVGIMFVMVTAMGYFFSRTRLMARELTLVKQESSGA